MAILIATTAGRRQVVDNPPLPTLLEARYLEPSQFIQYASKKNDLSIVDQVELAWLR
ncbi:MAG TPA: hypothetical protein VFI27_08110 [candidate division Zixibacteria bacterium]|nr:hypothetical protein [candidate division Zixibacteria bacterium]